MPTDDDIRNPTSLPKKIKASIERDMSGGIHFYERRPGIYQTIIPIFHEDGDMLDIYVQDSPNGDGCVRVCNFGMALMRLSYAFDALAPAHERILESVLINNGVTRGDDGLYLDAPIRTSIGAYCNSPDAFRKSALCAIGMTIRAFARAR